MKKYMTRWETITTVEVERESENSVWIDGRRQNKISDFCSYFDTEDEARSHIVRVATREVENAQRQLNYKLQKLEAAKSATVKP